MDFTEKQIIAMVSGIILPLFRISAMIMSMPVIGTKMVPNRIKVTISVIVTIVIYPLLKDVPQVNLLDPNFIILVLQQLLVGVTIGFIFQLVFQTLIMAGDIISMQCGLSYATLVDPTTQDQMPMLSHFYVTMASLIFITLNGHLLLLQLIINSFTFFPIDTVLISQDGFITLVRSSGIIFLNGVIIALPAIISLLLANISLAIMTRAAPQLNIFSLGFGITLLLGFFLLLFSLADVSRQFYHLLEQAITVVNDVMR
jgi:flagellar biosynthetic protein FliR